MQRLLFVALSTVALAACSSELSAPSTPLAQSRKPFTPVQYEIVKLTTLGGSPNRGLGINEFGWVAGYVSQTDGHRRAARWRGTALEVLGTLGGPSSTVTWPGVNNVGTVVGISQTATPDPNHEYWSCEDGGFLPDSTGLICGAFIFERGRMRQLPTLGGNNAFATSVNDRNQAVGWAETPVHDPTCDPSVNQVLGFKAVQWSASLSGRIETRELAPLPGDSASAATTINDLGVSAGISGACDQAVGRFSARHSVIWRNGRPIRIPDFGGTSWNTPMKINLQGDVVGFANPPGADDAAGNFVAHAFYWPAGSSSMIDLKTLPGDALSEAFSINLRRQIVGVSFGGVSGSRGFLYQDGTMTSLNALFGVTNGDSYQSGQDINDRGQITGRVLDHASGKVVPFIATPIGR